MAVFLLYSCTPIQFPHHRSGIKCLLQVRTTHTSRRALHACMHACMTLVACVQLELQCRVTHRGPSAAARTLACVVRRNIFGYMHACMHACMQGRLPCSFQSCLLAIAQHAVSRSSVCTPRRRCTPKFFLFSLFQLSWEKNAFFRVSRQTGTELGLNAEKDGACVQTQHKQTEYTQESLNPKGACSVMRGGDQQNFPPLGPQKLKQLGVCTLEEGETLVFPGQCLQ